MSDSLQPQGLKHTRLLCSWDSRGKNTGVGCHFLLQGIFLTQGLNPCLLHLLHCRQILYSLSHLGSPLQLYECIRSTHHKHTVLWVDYISIKLEKGQKEGREGGWNFSWQQWSPGGPTGKEPTCHCRRQKRRTFNPWVGKIPWRRAWQPTQYSCLENPMDRDA